MDTRPPRRPAAAAARLGALLPLALLALLTPSCGEEIEDPGDGSLEVAWSVAPRGCAQAGVRHVDVVLRRDGLERRERLSCDAQRGVIEGVGAHEYKVTLYGVDGANQETFVSEAERVRIEPGRMASLEDPVRLSARPAQGVLAWRFGDGRVCGAHGVKTVHVVFYDSWDSEVVAGEFECNQGSGELGEIPAGTYQVYAEAVGSQEIDGQQLRSTFQGVVDVTLGRGARAAIDLVLFEQIDALK